MANKIGYLIALALVLAVQNPSDLLNNAQAQGPDGCTASDALLSDSEAWVATSWGHFDRRAYREAIANVRACLPRWAASAQQMQDQLDGDHAPVLPEGTVDEATRAAIYAQGVLNDVGTSYWILGRSHDLLGDRSLAIAAYRDCERVSRALTWDERGWFWRPATGCREYRLALERAGGN